MRICYWNKAAASDFECSRKERETKQRSVCGSVYSVIKVLIGESTSYSRVERVEKSRHEKVESTLVSKSRKASCAFLELAMSDGGRVA